MSTMMARETWTDERLDDLNARVDEGFKEMREEFRAVRLELRTEIGSVRSELKAETGTLRSEVKAEIGTLRSETNQQFASLQRTILQLSGGMFVTFVIGIISVIATQ